MFAVAVILFITVLGYMWDSSRNKKNQDERERILCEIDVHRMKEIARLKAEVETLRKAT